MSKNQVAIIEKNIVDNVTNRVREFQRNGELVFPENYIPENALKSAYLMLQETQDKDKKPVLQTCTKPSIANALLSMVVQGLNPEKKQCYFIPYGNKLVLHRSYFGAMHVAKTVDPNIQDIYGMTVYEGDEFEYEIKHGKYVVTLHKQKLQNIHKDKIVAAYGTILYKDGREISEVLTIDQIKQAWKQSAMKPVDEKGNIKAGSTHDKFTADMAEKTAINKVCKYVINSSSDTSIVVQFAKKLDSEIAEAETQAIIEENANQELLDFDTEDVIEADAEVVDVEPIKEDKPKKEPEQIIIDEGPGY
ncbi:recombination protein RecT [Proteiniborus sp. DW1]|uniref:recombinase RecT n=1 Tax=Proteiniborus sp. DW1 TaxID=1889883 RepID=UPI00092DECDF|nr:recombinase RecT [Proteiniborus sp. DW1]SCG82688.1 recombination protein RecT [Proteiniborus sp. DW1]